MVTEVMVMTCVVRCNLNLLLCLYVPVVMVMNDVVMVVNDVVMVVTDVVVVVNDVVMVVTDVMVTDVVR
ncbi:hypothetical protein Pmani_019467 [Petrolisthes manimaculis]|uniref:Uncharacterized protein n=1 Tax=Petrolisthes manimaculis TaxID=1843537 RepID=A0AAE1U3H8_9EUCA|nr:hypothetical protein Pmani_019467 [Petrolisthes manimaculis]